MYDFLVSRRLDFDELREALAVHFQVPAEEVLLFRKWPDNPRELSKIIHAAIYELPGGDFPSLVQLILAERLHDRYNRWSFQICLEIVSSLAKKLRCKILIFGNHTEPYVGVLVSDEDEPRVVIVDENDGDENPSDEGVRIIGVDEDRELDPKS